MKDAVGPVLRMGERIDAVIDAIRDDNPDQEIEVVDQGAYVRVHAAGRLKVSLPSLRRHLGAAFEMRQLEPMLAAFAGRITTTSYEVRWSLGPAKDAANGSLKEGGP
jgi:toluene monooxygenase system protein D